MLQPRREQVVLRTAAHEFGAKGFSGASMKELARALGLSKSSVYHYATSKESLLSSVLADIHLRVMALAGESCSTESPAPQRIRRLLSALLAWMRAEPEAAAVYLHEWRHASDDVTAAQLQRLFELTSLVESLVRDGQRDGDFARDRDPSAIAIFLVNAVATGVYGDLLGDARPPRPVDIVELALACLTPSTRAGVSSMALRPRSDVA